MTGVTVTPKLRDEIAAHVAELYGITPQELKSGLARRKYSHPRQHAMWLLRQRKRSDGKPVHSYPAIGRAFGLDHSTVIHGVRAYNNRVNANCSQNVHDCGTSTNHGLT